MSNRLPPAVTGAWLVHHEQKLSAVKVAGFDATISAGRTARVLSLITREDEWEVPLDRVEALAKANQINRLELRASLTTLSEQGLIDLTDKAVAVLGVTQSMLLNHAATMFDAESPDNTERAAIVLAEMASEAPVKKSECAEEIGDTFKLSNKDVGDLFEQAEQIGFIDYDGDGADKLYFNGSLFRRDVANKAALILNSLKSDEQARLAQADALLSKSGCVLKSKLIGILGDALWGKLHQIGFYDVSTVSNNSGDTEFVSLPGALSKYVPESLADMLDDAKALASSLTYGIAISDTVRGRIQMPSQLLSKLISRGYVEGRAFAIASDYHVPEQRGVVQVTRTDQGYRLTLLKKEVGEMARALILEGDASEVAAGLMASGAAKAYRGPEMARVAARKPFVGASNRMVRSTLDILRKS
jgi:hypothetical protein